MPGCFVYGCTGKGTGVHLFRIPKKCSDVNRTKWLTTISKVRSDKRFDPNNKNHCICHKHFDDKYLIKDDVTVVNGTEVRLPRQRWTLADDSIPTIFLSIPHNPHKASPKKRKSPTERSQITSKLKRMKTVCYPVPCNLHSVDASGTSDIPLVIEHQPTTDIGTLKDIMQDWDTSPRNHEGWELKYNRTAESEMCYIIQHKYGELAVVSKQLQVSGHNKPRVFKNISIKNYRRLFH